MQSNNLVINNKEINILSSEDFELYSKTKSSFKEKKTIATHSGTFHADEVLALSMVKYIEQFKNFWIIRSRNQAILNDADLVCDVGGIYDDSKYRYDHHMKEFNYNFDEVQKIKMSSAGLIYKHHGKEIIKNILKLFKLDDENEEKLKIIYDKVYKSFIAYVDGNDNGITQYPGDVKPLYVNTTGYTHRIARLNPEWNEPDMDQSVQFLLAMNIAEEELFAQIKFIAKSFLPAYSIVKDAIDNRERIHKSGKIIYMTTYCPWKEHLYNIEEKLGIKDEIKFIIVNAGEEGYRVNTIPITSGSFNFRKGIFSEWRGLNLEELKNKSNIDDIIFVHSTGFIGGAKSYDSALKMAEISLEKN